MIGARFPSPLAGEGGPRSGSDEGLKIASTAFPNRQRDPSSVGFADTFSRKGRREEIR